MFSYLILSTLLGLTYSNWTRTPQIKIDNFNSTDSVVTMNIDNFYHLNYPNAYDLDLYYRQGISNSRNLSDYEKINNTQLLEQGCSYFERKIIVEDQIQIQLPDDGKYIFTDLAVIGQSAFLLRNDNKIFSLEIVFNGQELQKIRVQQQHLDISGDLKVNQYKKPRFLQIRDQLFIISENGAISFNSKQWTNNTLPKINKHSIESLKIINHLHYDEISNRVFVVAGTQGVIVYKLENEELKKLYTIDLDYNLIKVQTNENNLFILDDRKGIHFVSLQENNYIIDKFQIPIEYPISFVYKNNSFLVVSQTEDKVRFGIEILINFKNQEYYYNKFYLEDMQLKDVQEAGEYKVLIGYDVHKLVRTNIYRGFVDENFYHGTDFMIPLLEKIQEFNGILQENSNQKIHYQLGLTPHYLFGLSIKEKYPEIICSSQNQIEQSYMIVINSTQCINTEKNPFVICQEQHLMNLSINEVFLDFQSQLLVEVVLILGFIIFIIFLVFSIIMCRRWRFAIENMKKKNKQYVNVQVG
ncbi:unnamed protein product [Paramecium pentaurelia]|uniref:Transmembrane protein n=1 Tax=Paramecium pentaurelia TaxID=43138 RepID=A0A8S1W8C8_9CILI|nr:unnamed protein product [Paramecium pentaurelia]